MIISARNTLFNYGILESKLISIPTICIGNLSIGGNGKTPLTNYIAKILSKNYNVAILSRGYGRLSKGFYLVNTNSDPLNIGDEPLQLKISNPDCIVAVNSNRHEGILKIMHKYPQTQVILMDDGFQHRWVRAGLNIIISTYQNLYTKDNLLPLGTLREPKKEAKRAEIIIVSKTPYNLNQDQKSNIIKNLKLNKNQTGYITSIKYNKYKCVFNNTELKNEEDYSVTLITGIVNHNLLVEHLKKLDRKVNLIKYSDHHNYTSKDINDILLTYKKDKNTKKLILTTEKDATKIRKFDMKFRGVKVYFIPIEIIFSNKKIFEKQILEYVKEN
jgi:tetraacyldisaccharide 4'-kinase